MILSNLLTFYSTIRENDFDELCKVNIRVGCIARSQAEMGGYTMHSTLVAPTNESDANDTDDDKDDDDASSPSDDEMST